MLDEEMKEEQFALFKTQNKNQCNYQIVTEHHILLAPFVLTIKPLIFKIHTDVD